ncbi:MAG TPA: hypothetical protein VN207_12820, partial [Ktedonobacteraceae bacterium]|nr:hypothetical protein [Ktedonobacteraceae bacterium]
MMSEFILTVTLQNKVDVEARFQNDDSKLGKVQLDLLHLDTINIFKGWLSQEGKVNQRKEFEVLGRHLYTAIFNEDVEKLFEASLAKAQESS